MTDDTSLELRREATALLQKAPQESGMDFVNRLLDHPNVGGLIEALEPEEFYALMLSVGKSDCFDLIRYCSEEQLQGLVDLDLWVNGRFSPIRFEQFLGMAASAGEEAVAKVIESIEDPQVGIYLLRRCQVIPRTGDPDQEDAIPDMGETILTPDNLFYLVLPKGNTWYGLLKSFIDSFYYLDRERIVALLMSASGEDADVLELEELRARANRLVAMGFPTLKEAEHLFDYINPVQTREAIRSKLEKLAEVPFPGDNLLPVLLEVDRPKPAFLRQVLDALVDDPKATNRVTRSMVSLANHMVMWQTRDDLADAETTTQGIQRALRFLSLGLEYVAEGSVSVAQAVVRKVKATTLFRIGFSLSLMVRTAARELVALSGQEQGFFLFDPPLDDTVKAASLAIPQYFEGLVDEARNTVKDFESLAELRRTRAALKQAKGVAEFVARTLRLDLSKLEAQVEKDLRPMVTHTTLMATALVNGMLGVEPWLTPVPAADIPKVMDILLLPSASGERLLNPRFAHAVEQFFQTEKDKFAGALMDLAVKKLEVVFKRLPHGTIPDARFLADTLLVGRLQ